MKKSYLFLSFILVVALLCSFAFANPVVSQKDVYASQINKPHGQHIIVVGKGEVETEPDTIKVSFGLKCRDESLQSGQTKIRENINTVISKIKETNKNAEVYTNYMSSYPVFENGLLAYEFDCCLVAKSSDVNNQNALVDAIVEAGATNIHSTRFLLTNQEDAYIKALVKAKENAENKVKAIYENANFIGLKEEATYNYCEGSIGEKIKITAKVNAFYEIPQDLETTSDLTKNTTSTENNLNKNDSVKKLQNKDTLQKAFETSRNSTLTNASESATTESEKEEKTNQEDIIENKEKTTKQDNANNNVTKESSSNSLTENNEESDKIKDTENANAEVTNKDKTNELKTEKQENKKDINNSSKNLLDKTNQTSKIKTTKQNSETRKIIDADGNVVVELF